MADVVRTSTDGREVFLPFPPPSRPPSHIGRRRRRRQQLGDTNRKMGTRSSQEKNGEGKKEGCRKKKGLLVISLPFFNNAKSLVYRNFISVDSVSCYWAIFKRRKDKECSQQSSL